MPPTPPASTSITVVQALSWATALGLDRLDGELLLLHTLSIPSTQRAWLRAHDTDALTLPHWEAFQQLCHQRHQHMPLAYLTGQKAFYGLDLTVDARVLDPRPDTETLVDWALELLPQGTSAGWQVADLGTGSGAIALALAQHRPHLTVYAVDQSTAALAVAQSNAQRLHLPIRFIHGQWLTDWRSLCGMDALPTASLPTPQLHLIVSNPPYIASNDPHLQRLQHEPQCALVSGIDGLDDIRLIVQQATTHLTPNGWLLLEHGHEQGPAVQALLATAGFKHTQARHDLTGTWRCTGGQWPDTCTTRHG